MKPRVLAFTGFFYTLGVSKKETIRAESRIAFARVKWKCRHGLRRRPSLQRAPPVHRVRQYNTKYQVGRRIAVDTSIEYRSFRSIRSWALAKQDKNEC